MKILALAAAMSIAGCVTLPEVEIYSEDVLALCAAAPAPASLVNPSVDTKNRLQAIADKCAAARTAEVGAIALTPAIINLVSRQAVTDQANDVAVVKAATK